MKYEDIRCIKWYEIEKGMRIRVNENVVWEFQEYDKENDEWDIIVYTIENGELRKQFLAGIKADDYTFQQNYYRNIYQLDMLNLEKDEKLKEVWDKILEYGIATENELRLACYLCGCNLKTLNNVILARTGDWNIEQYEALKKDTEEESEEIEEV